MAAGRPKTTVRILLEEFLTDDCPVNEREDWIDFGYTSKQGHNRITSIAYSMRQAGYPIDAVETDREHKIVWIHRRSSDDDDDTPPTPIVKKEGTTDEQ